MRVCDLGPRTRVLEIGPRTGQATRRLLDALERLATDELGGVVERPYLSPVHLAQTIPQM